MTRILQDLDDFKFINGRKWKLGSDFVIYTDTLGIISVPAGETTDFNSIPQFLWNILPPTDYCQAGVAHDFLFTVAMVGWKAITRQQANEAHAEILEYLQAPKWRRFVYAAGLKVGSKGPWDDYRRKDASGNAERLITKSEEISRRYTLADFFENGEPALGI